MAGVELSNSVAFFAIATNLVTYLTTMLHESKIAAARNASMWSGAYFLAPLLGAFVADTYCGRYRTTVVFLPVYIVVSINQLSNLIGIVYWLQFRMISLSTGDDSSDRLCISPIVLRIVPPW